MGPLRMLLRGTLLSVKLADDVKKLLLTIERRALDAGLELFEY